MKIEFILKIIVIFCFLLLLYIFASWSVRHVLLGGTKLEKFNNIIIQIAIIPENFQRIINGINNDIELSEKRFGDKKGFISFDSAKNLDGYLLLARYDGEIKRSIVEIYDFENDKIIHSYLPDIKNINSKSKLSEKLLRNDLNLSEKRYLIRHPLLLNDGSIIFNSGNSPLVRIDSCSNLIWTIDKMFHHSKELDAYGNIFVSLIDNDNLQSYNELKNDTIAKVSIEGEIIQTYNVIDILRSNNIEPFSAYSGDDPIHLNDIQPVLNDGLFWRKDDLFLSIRSLSLVLLYRPSTNKIIWQSFGPWIYQHDVDILKDNKILIFNNNLNFDKKLINKNNNLVLFNFNEKSYNYPFINEFKENDIRTRTEGRSEILDNGYLFVEETNSGRILIFDEKGNVNFMFINKYSGGTFPLSWSRYLSKKKYSVIIENLKSKNCN